MKQKHIVVFGCMMLCALSVGVAYAYAQSDGSVPTPGAESVTRPTILTVPEVATSTVAVPVPTITPLPRATPPPVSTPPATAPESLPAEVEVSKPEEVDLPDSNNIFFIILAGIGIVVLAALGIWKGTQGNNEKKNEDCAPLKSQLEQKKSERDVAISELSAQQIAVDFLKKKIEETAKDAIMKAAGEGAREAKALYDDVQEKYEQAKTALEFLKKKQTMLTEEAHQLESAYVLCKGSQAADILQSGPAVEFSDTNYEGTIIEESLADVSVLKEVNIRSTKVEPVTEKHKTPWVTQWTLHEVEVAPGKAAQLAERIQKALDHTHPWYADYKTDRDHYIIYRDAVFHITDRSDKKQYHAATEHGIAIGIPAYQLDFSESVRG